MNKNLLYLFIVTTGIFCTPLGASAKERKAPPVRQIQQVVSDTPYFVLARIVRTGVRDTPYLVFTASPSSVYKEVEQALTGEKGLFKVELAFYSGTGIPVRNEQYLINKREE